MKKQQKARLAFIGAGNFATEKLYPCIPASPDIELVAVCDIDRDKAERNARNYGATKAYSNIEEMLDKEKLNGVFCVGPGPMQYELAPLVLRRGLPVFVEKPSAITSEQAQKLAEYAQAYKTWGQVGFMKRFASVYLMVKDVLSREEFGKAHVFKFGFAQGPYGKIWGMDSAPRSMLVGQLCHTFDLARFFGGEITSVTSSYHEASPTQYAYLANVEFASGAVGHFDMNSLESEYGFRDILEEVTVVGQGTHLVSRNMLTLDWQPRADWTAVARNAGRYLHSFSPTWNGVHPTSIFLGYQLEIGHFAKRCLGEAEGGPDLWDSCKALQIGEAVYESAIQKKTINLV
jgi:predicted dehydrogenase